ncbi:MAG: flavin reductase family protein [Steroidobacteraceae bacterium]
MSKALRNAWGQYPTGVTIVTARDSTGNPIGLTASSFVSVSVEPPLISWNLGRGSSQFQRFLGLETFAVHVLHAGQRDLALKFASSGADKFGGLPLREGLGRVPLLDDWQALFQCRTHAVHEAGDHLIIIGEVLAFDTQEGREALVYYRGGFGGPST